MDALTSRQAESLTPQPPFLRSSSLETSHVASCGNHDHLALIYDNQEEQLDIVVPFLRMGLERGEKCVFIVDDTNPATVIAAMERYGIDVESARASGALSIITKHDAYLKNGDFDPDWMIGFLAQAVEDAKREGFRAVRASGEMTWALGPAGEANGRLIEYECKVNAFFEGYDMGGICQYSRRRFRPETLMHIIHTHPRLIFKGQVFDNPYYIPPEIMQRSGSGPADALERLLESMAENTRLRSRLTAETEALRRSEKLAAAGRMAATIAHEINNPLESVFNLCYLLRNEQLSPDGRAYLETLEKELNRVSHIAKQTLAFYRVDATSEQFNLPSLIDDAARLCFERVHAVGASIEVRHTGPSEVCGFSGELRQVIDNLIVNALEAGAGKIHIRTSASRDWRRPTRRGVRIFVADNGPGIPQNIASKVFEPFFTTKDEKGTGLGLWVGLNIVQKHEGSILVHTSTRPGHSGTAFSIFLPTH